MAKWIKNDSGSLSTYKGKDLLDQEYYEIQSHQLLTWTNDSKLLTDIGSGDAVVAKDDSGTEDITDVNAAINYLKDIKTTLEVDGEGRQVSRTAYGNKGWSYLARPVEFETATIGAAYSKDWRGTDRGDYHVKFYNALGIELVAGTQLELDMNCVETRITIKPEYDFEVISGKVDQVVATVDDIRMWVVGGVIDDTTNYPWEYPADSGIYHVKEFAGGINFKYKAVCQSVETDGRASKFMPKVTTGVPYQTNQFQVIMKHAAGIRHNFMLILEYFRA